MYVTSPVVSLSRKIEMSYDILDMHAGAREGIMGRGPTAPQAFNLH
jgi:hypothetical protein